MNVPHLALMCYSLGGMKMNIMNILFIKVLIVNIGGLPFLPKATDIVEQFVERLIERSPEEIQREGILPLGTKEEWKSSLVEQVLVGVVPNKETYIDFIQNGHFNILINKLKKGWQEAKYVALYTTSDVHDKKGE